MQCSYFSRRQPKYHTVSHLPNIQCISYIKMKVCVCVCPVACCRTHTSFHPEIWCGLLISPMLGTKLGGNYKCWPPGVPPIVTMSEFPRRVNNWAGASKQKLLFGMCLQGKILLVGGLPQPRAHRVHSSKWGYML